MELELVNCLTACQGAMQWLNCALVNSMWRTAVIRSEHNCFKHNEIKPLMVYSLFSLSPGNFWNFLKTEKRKYKEQKLFFQLVIYAKDVIDCMLLRVTQLVSFAQFEWTI
jgi:hypothetical protein